MIVDTFNIDQTAEIAIRIGRYEVLLVMMTRNAPAMLPSSR